jgi:adenylate cyclase
MSEIRKIAAILVADVVGYSRLAGADEEGTLARLRALRNDLIDPAIAVHRGRVVKRTGDGFISEFRSVVDATRCAVEVQTGMIGHNADVPAERRIELRIGIHLGDVVEETDGDLMGDGVNIAARLESIANPGAICLSEQAYWQVKGRLDLRSRTSAQFNSRTSPSRSGPIRLKSVRPPAGSPRRPQRPKNPSRGSRLSSCPSPISGAARSRSISSTGSRRALRPTFREFGVRS